MFFSRWGDLFLEIMGVMIVMETRKSNIKYNICIIAIQELSTVSGHIDLLTNCSILSVYLSYNWISVVQTLELECTNLLLKRTVNIIIDQ